ncbi:MAG: ATP synthase F0 subunit A [Verrucomicrobia bacterium CG1_02_43_26]|nr:MAG: ATP synthase F0 subunit A [Verrucomicrobia bacterium CG1_02_43_26]
MASGAFASTEAVSPKAYILYSIGGLHITNSMVTSWVVSLLIIVGIRWMAGGRHPKLIPSKGQAVIESMLDGVKDIINPIVGKKVADKAFPLLIGFFFFILIQNISGLIPGVGTFGHYDESGHLLYYFRPGNADLNMTLALAIVSFIAWLYFIFRYVGFKGVVYDLFGNKAERKEVPGWLYYPLFVVFFGVGIIEVISILFRLVSLTFRLFGNIFGGENLLTSMHGIFAYILPVPFYFLEMLIALIQALVFTLLVAVYIGLICNHGDEEEHA